ncbi:unnamed protein product [Commensalibacter communis]|uniref:Lipoprotein n=1 Tax=Commensalibacter communis TaxID=2972786 RepID=A0A9W4TPM5_9PROT|nr:hypothetical protein [Commensalibacter communis]CAI3953355.1 unnamed protein product [Commensalibacter communis]CAI3956414.1 unnamed protein product [Commensalibacter communis]CAI3956826.1 unnamed protein product [Commensalibacter communis]CAI3957230.1 unnamed protein product [Commensalibacter communis]
MKLICFLSILLSLGLTSCTDIDWASVGKTSLERLSDEQKWYSSTPPERQYKLGTGEYPDPHLSDVMRQDYETQKKQEQWFKDVNAKK